MDLTIFRLEDYASHIDGGAGAAERFQHLRDLTREQFDFLVDLVDSTDDYDWR